MAMSIDELADAIKNLTVLQASELAKKLQDDLGIQAAAPVAVAAGGAAAPAAGGGGPAPAAEEEQTEFNVILTGFAADKKINVIKVVREITSLGLKEAKDLVEGAPKPIREGIAKEEAANLKAKLEEAGATVDVK